MRKLSSEEFTKEWVTFCSNLEKVGIEKNYDIEKLREQLERSSGALSEDTGIAYPGALLCHINLFTAIAQRIAKMVAGTFSVDEKSLLKVCLLQHLSKIYMYIPNDNEWRMKNLGENFKFAELDGNLKFGERSIYCATTHGITFTPEEWEAMESMDKAKESNGMKYAECILSTIVRQANELAYAIEKERNKNK